VKVTVIDYGLGNLFSIQSALAHLGAQMILTDRPEQVLEADRLILPGVGAFRDGMEGLRLRSLVEPIREYAGKGRPLLGICLGMQMLADQSEEFGIHQGLGLIPGANVAIPRTLADGSAVKVPHIGWNGIHPPAGARDWKTTPLGNTPPGTAFYFVHSFTVVPTNESDRLADAWYRGRRIAAVIGRDNTFGAQFHPEKSGPSGLKLLGNFLGGTF
jgi:glutamine amidotransferase